MSLKLKPLSILVDDLKRNDIVQFYRVLRWPKQTQVLKSYIGYYRGVNFSRAYFSIGHQVAMSESANFWVGVGTSNFGKLEKERHEDYLWGTEVEYYFVLQRDAEPIPPIT